MLEVLSSAHDLIFDLAVLLTPLHPQYKAAPAERDHALRRGLLRLTGDQVELTPPQRQVQSNNEYIEQWIVGDDGWSTLHGGWGSAHVLCHAVVLTVS